MKNIIIATTKSWNIENAITLKGQYEKKFNIMILTRREDFTAEKLINIDPEYVFLPHWSWKIGEEIFGKYKCVVFHTSNLPGGRGGSPIQNQIARGIYDSNICAIEVVKGYDEGSILLKEPISLREGTIDEILSKISRVIFEKMIPNIIENECEGTPQMGKSSYYERRTPSMSNLLDADIGDIRTIYDFIRMLDGEGYPKAFVEMGKYLIEFSEAELSENEVSGRFIVHEK